jgi:hypothetical protein
MWQYSCHAKSDIRASIGGTGAQVTIHQRGKGNWAGRNMPHQGAATLSVGIDGEGNKEKLAVVLLRLRINL